MRRLLKFLLKFLFLPALGVGTAYAGLIYHPHPLFPYRVRAGNLILHCDEPFAEADGRRVLHQTEDKLRASPLHDPAASWDVFVCNTTWRRRLFFLISPRAGGLHYYGASSVFLSGADFAAGRLIAPSGQRVEDERTLDYFITHEVAHRLCERTIGLAAFHQLPQWLSEGYVDYVGRGSVLARPDSAKAFLAEAPEMNWPAAAPYVRFNLLVGCFLEREHRDIAALLAHPPDRDTAEATARRLLDPARD